MVASSAVLAAAGIKKGDSQEVRRKKFIDYKVEKAFAKKEPKTKKTASSGMTAEQKIAKRRAEQQANPERFQSVIKNKNKVTKKLGNMGQDFRSVDKVVKADRERRRKTGDGEFGRARQAAMTRAANKAAKEAA
jgi:hypothetical protein